MNGPIVFWPRNVRFDEVEDGVVIEFTTEFPALRAPTDLKHIFALAFSREWIQTSSRDGVHRVSITRADSDITILKRRANRIISALTLISEDRAGPEVSLALGWNFIPGTREHTTVGELEKRAKWSSDPEATRKLCERTIRLVLAHDELQTAQAVAYVTSSKPFVRELAETVAEGLGGIPIVVCRKRNPKVRQSESDDALNFEHVYGHLQGNLTLPGGELADRMLIVDDLYRSGGTIMEVCRCLRDRGVSRVYSVTAAKTVQFHRQT